MIIIGQVGEMDKYESYFESAFVEDFTKYWNIREGQKCFTITSEKSKTLQKLNYGLIPFWAKSRKEHFEAPIDSRGSFDTEKGIKIRIINDPNFRKPIRENRSIIPADYFILVEEVRSILFFNMDRSPLSLAGVYDSWKAFIKAKETHTGFSLLTFPSIGIFNKFGFSRMPFILPERRFKKWLKDSLHLVEVTRMIEPYDERLLNAYEIDTNKVLQGVNDRKITFPTSKLLRPLKEKSFISSSRILKSHRYKRGATHNLENQEQRIWRQ